MSESTIQQESAATDTREEERVFGFFWLPRELRNEIYKNLTTEREICSGLAEDEGLGIAGNHHVVIHNAPIEGLSQLSRQFGAEYRDQLKRCQTVHIKDVGASFESVILTRDLCGVTTAKITIWASLTYVDICEDLNWRRALSDVSSHATQIQEALMLMSDLESMVIELYLHSSAASPQD
ncbi:hypothetical protein LTR37_003553 [Vermiconidia calcicola]|uniref:Uncharacterized protein n=1 Tax=Vermiconidia calcicola TaxID=1690605 RepID=A0ACC3NQ63_9PEZI|nr:hypothetical protein LTR37_003553 [Vermiconidia calcicola]